MAGDWIKMRTDLYRDPKVCVIADLLMSPESELSRYVSQHTQRDMSVTRNVTRNVTVGALVSVWGVLRHRGKRVGDDLVVKNCSLSIVDDLADIPGFGDAMAAVGWAEETPDGIVFRRFFEEFNIDPAEEKRKKAADRQRHRREKIKQESVTLLSRSCHTPVTQNVALEERREEKRREEENTPPPPSGGEVEKPKPLKFDPRKIEIPPELDTVEFRDAWQTWCSHRTEKKKPLTPTSVKLQFRSFVQWGVERSIAAMLWTAEKGWEGLQEPSGKVVQNPIQKPTLADRKAKLIEEFLGDNKG